MTKKEVNSSLVDITDDTVVVIVNNRTKKIFFVKGERRMDQYFNENYGTGWSLVKTKEEIGL